MTLIERDRARRPPDRRRRGAGRARGGDPRAARGRRGGARGDRRACAAAGCGWRRSRPPGATLMPLAIATFRAAHPEVELTLAEGEPEEIVPRLRAGEFDLVAAVRVPWRQRDARRRPATRRAARGPDARRAPRRAPAGRQAGRVRLEDLQRGVVGPDLGRRAPCARHVVRSCHAAGFEPRVSFESDDYQTVQGLVAAGVGVALIPELALSSARDDIVIRPLHPDEPVRGVLAATPEERR